VIVTAQIRAWCLTDDRPDSSAHARTIFALSNGFIGLRGSLEEDEDIADQGLVNGFYETWPITYPEDAYGLARFGQTIVPALNPTRFALTVNGQPFWPAEAEPRSYRRHLDLGRGVLDRRVVWAAPDGTEVTVESSRLVSVAYRACALVDYAVTVSTPAEVELTHWLTFPRAAQPGGHVDPRHATALADPIAVTQIIADPDVLAAAIRTAASGIGLACTVVHQVTGPDDLASTIVRQPTGLGRRVSARLGSGQTLRLSALAAFATDGPRLTDEATGLTDQQLLDDTRHITTRLSQRPWSRLDRAQERVWADWWQAADITVESPDDIQGTIRWNLFQVFQATACADGLGLPAKGVTGSGYDGHVFWDAEAMMLPALTYTRPELARQQLSYRHATLDRARQRAIELHHAGALFAWRGIDGREASAFFEAGTAQYHIDADIAYAVNRYVMATGDTAYLADQAIDLLVETARMWASLGFFDAAGVFHIHGVTGPDEYSALVDDNLYTNVMAAANLQAAADWSAWLSQHDPAAWQAAQDRLGLDSAELTAWPAMAAAVALPYDAGLGLHGQDAGFLSRQVWDFAGTPPQSYPLLLHYHPLTIYRHQVLKQADLVLAMINRPDLFTPAQMRANFDYYDRLTTGDSTLSASAQAIMAATTGQVGLAERYFRTSLVVDLDDTHGNSSDGVHVAAAAATWSILIQGFAGFRDWGGPSLDPHLPPGWTRLGFRLRLGQSTVDVVVRPAGVELTLVSGDPVGLTICGQTVEVSGTCQIDLAR